MTRSPLISVPIVLATTGGTLALEATALGLGTSTLGASALATALTAGLATRLGADRITPGIVGGLCGAWLAGLVNGYGIGESVFLALLRAIVAVVAALIVRRLGDAGPRWSPRNLGAFLVGGGIVAPLVGAAFAGMTRLVPLADLAMLFSSLAVCMSIVGPLAIVGFVEGRGGRAGDRFALPDARRLAETAVAGAVIVGTTLAVFGQNRYPALFVILPVLILATLRLRFGGAIVSVVAVTLVGWVETRAGSGPIAGRLLDLGERHLVLVGFLLLVVLSTMPLASILADQARGMFQLALREEQLREFVEHAPLAMFRCDDTGRIVFASGRWRALVGSSAQSWIEAVASREREEIDTHWRSAVNRRAPFEAELALRRSSGAFGWSHLILMPEADGHWTGIAQDHSTRGPQDELRESSERQYRLLAEHSSDMIVRVDRDGVRRFVSAASRTILGFEPEEMVGTSPIAVIHPDDRARVARTWEQVFAGEPDLSCAYRKRRRDGSYVWLEATYQLVRDEAGQPVEFVASERDIGRRRSIELEHAAAHARLEETNRLLAMAEDLAGIGHWRYDMIGGELFWSDEVFRIHGLAEGAAPSFDDAIAAYHPDDRSEVVSIIGEAQRNGTPWRMQKRLLNPDGAVRHVEATGQVERAPDGTIVGLFGVFRDVTAAVDAQAALTAARDEARAAAEARSDFLATMSHEIRTPMTGVLGMIELLRGDLPATERQRFFENLEQSATLLMRVLDDILDFSRIDARTLVFEEIDFDPAQLVRSALDLFHHAASSKGLLLALETFDGVGRVRGDPVRLQQILSNLISNAVKFTPQGQVIVRGELIHDGSEIRLRVDVADTGIGIEPEAMARLFEPFVQAAPSVARRFGGTGLGLAISRRLAEAMDGSLELDSTPGSGTIAHLDVRLFQARGEADVLPAPSGLSHRLSVLVAEDNQISRTLVEALVRRGGHDVTAVENGVAALAAANAGRYDLILMDMQMPEMDGLTAARAIRGGAGPCRDVPIVALTADASIERRHLYDGAALTDFLTKPVDSRSLLERLDAIAAGRPIGAVPTEEGADRLLDENKLDDLTREIGHAGAARLVAMFAEELRTAPSRIARLVDLGLRPAADQAIHSFKGAAQNLGALRLVDVATRLESAMQTEGLDSTVVVEELASVAEETRIAIDRRIKTEPSSVARWARL